MAIDYTKPVATRNGKKVRIVCTDVKSEHFPLLVLIEEASDFESIQFYTAEGTYLYGSGIAHHLDLINI